MHQQFRAIGRSVFIFVLGTFLLSLSLFINSFAQGNRPEKAKWGDRGQSAIARLGSRLPEVAARYNMTPGQLAQTFRTDFNLWVSGNDKLVYLDEAVVQNGAPVTGGGTTAAGPVPYAQTFQLHSLPGATKVIYLDFDGHTTSGTYWNSNFNGGADIVSAPFDMDGIPGSFSNAEQDRIQYIWQRVAEEYAPFGVDVTTQDPGVDVLSIVDANDQTWGIRAVISPTNTFYPNAGGVAWISSFNWGDDTPCFIFSSMLGPNSEKYVADAIAHEVGHTLGLNHDGKTDGTAYYQGNYDSATGTTKVGLPAWAPIMGVGYYQSLVQWSKGEYALSNNTQDDLTVMTTGYGITYRNDDHSNAISGATPMTVTSSTTVTGKGIIERTTDTDYLSFQTGAGTVSFTVTGNPRDSNLDVQAKLFDANGTQIVVNNPAGLSASFTTTLAAGTYYLAIDGVGTGDPATGYYSDYGSLGEFNVSGTVVAATANQAPVAAATGTPTSGAAQLTVAFSSAGSTDADGTIASYSWNFGNGSTATTANPSTVYNTAGTYSSVLTITDNKGATSTKTVTVTVTAAVPAAPTGLAATAASASQINVNWLDASNNETGFRVERSLNNSVWSVVSTVAANATAFSDTGLSGGTVYYYRVCAMNGTTASAYSNTANTTTPVALPSVPSNLTATAVSTSQINLNWLDASSNETGFKIERSLNTATWTLITTTGSNVTSYSNTGLTASTLYYYRVRATNAAGDSANSNVAQATTQAAATATMHIGDIDYTKTLAKTGGTWSTTVTVKAENASHGILANATVAASWSNGTTASCKTSTKGTCTMSLSGLASTTTGVTFSVTNVTLSGYSYAAASNHDPDTGTAASNGTSVTIAKP